MDCQHYLNWTNVDRYHQTTDCEKWTVAKIGSAHGWRWEAWRTPAHKEGRRCLGSYRTAQEARQAAERDAQ